MRYFLLSVTFFLTAFQVHAEPTIEDINSVAPGGLYFATADPGKVVRAPTLQADVSMEINGPLVRTRVVQHFVNTGQAFVEGLYTYPLPKGSAVDNLEILVGDRRIVGVIKEKQEAQRQYDQARAEGKRASIVIQRRPNIFSTRIANIAPGETLSVAIEYQDVIEPRNDTYELRFPMVVRPRYIPGQPLNNQTGTGNRHDTDQVPDGASITQPIIDAADIGHNPLALNIALNAGFPLDSLTSPSHTIATAIKDGKTYIRLADGQVPADQDFILRWTPVSQDTPRVGLFSEQTGETYNHLLVMLPPAQETVTADRAARALTIVLDKSGSMSGQAIRHAKSAVRQALIRLQPGDYFNIIAFDDDATRLFDGPVPLDNKSLAQALDFLDDINADGGTEMSKALSFALPSAVVQEGLLKQVIFITDGAVGNETDLMAQIKQNLGNTRLFTVGIGSAPNNYFMAEAAHFGRGSFINIAMNDDVLLEMNRLFRIIESPQLTDITLTGISGINGMAPERIPDLYTGDPIILAFRTDQPLPEHFSVQGTRQGQPWRMDLSGEQSTPANGVARLWARRMIQTVNRAHIGLYDPEAQAERRETIVELALSHHLVSEFTSLVAIEEKIVRPASETLFGREVAANLPAGMNMYPRFTLKYGAGPAIEEDEMVAPRSTATSMERDLLIGLLLLVISLITFISLRHRWRLA